MEEKVAEITEDWAQDSGKNSKQTDREDNMTEGEWLDYYEENLAVSGSDE